eukprot:gnl/TRDRNA2_/TRDRNA2_191915_c0_seq1.p1 gnl/TRDRNA2_/TRDRNA2_191915_c0~~gnl/TRDRNA2_/TRDRNA2_191915_c0_seq1.p1  ORF type:complete len:131 (+),score=37.52 gnl/TRDRNA2_/TRDRNA2_191915_c0_seq1:81-473(+)
MVRLFLLLMAAASAAPLNMQLRGVEMVLASSAPAPVSGGTPGPAPCGPCCEEKKLKAELEPLYPCDGGCSSSDGGISTKKYMKKHKAAEKAERRCELKKAEKARKEDRERKKREREKLGPLLRKGPNVKA